MYNTIEILEDKNKIYLKNDFEKIICGNTNYFLQFSFDENWSAVEKKTAIFEVLGKKIIKEFTGNICNIPCMPNASHFLLALTCSPNENESYATNILRFELEKNAINEEIQQLDPFINYYSKLQNVLNEIKSGNFSVRHATTAEQSLTQVSLSGNDNISGNKNFVGNLTFNEKKVSTLNDLPNTNYLINSSMIVNQRNHSTYSGLNTYCVDRWKLSDSISFATQNFNGTWSIGLKETDECKERIIISQSVENFEHLKGKKVTASIKLQSLFEYTPESTYLSIYDGITRTETLINQRILFASVTKTISTNASMLVVEIKTGYDGQDAKFVVDWCKLEDGENATKYIPRLYPEELLLCQRYYQTVKLYGFVASHYSNTTINCPIPISVTMRNNPTLLVSVTPTIIGNSSSFLADRVDIFNYHNNICVISCKTDVNNLFSSNCNYTINNGLIVLDSEIY